MAAAGCAEWFERVHDGEGRGDGPRRAPVRLGDVARRFARLAVRNSHLYLEIARPMRWGPGGRHETYYLLACATEFAAGETGAREMPDPRYLVTQMALLSFVDAIVDAPDMGVEAGFAVALHVFRDAPLRPEDLAVSGGAAAGRGHADFAAGRGHADFAAVAGRADYAAVVGDARHMRAAAAALGPARREELFRYLMRLGAIERRISRCGPDPDAYLRLRLESNCEMLVGMARWESPCVAYALTCTGMLMDDILDLAEDERVYITRETLPLYTRKLRACVESLLRAVPYDATELVPAGVLAARALAEHALERPADTPRVFAGARRAAEALFVLWVAFSQT